MTSSTSICLVSILKDENRFLDEWLVYHRMIGIDHFFLYDDDPAQPLKDFLKPHEAYVTIINWWQPPGSTQSYRQGNQLTAYNHAVKNYASSFEWVVFLDCDEFIALKQHVNIHQFLFDYKDEVSISLNWRQFGHNGFFNDPTRLITSSLNRRMLMPFTEVKTITKTAAIFNITSPHHCELKYGERVDANHQQYITEVYESKSDIACINHYLCRSFKTWMKRVERGDVNCVREGNRIGKWRFDEEMCLERFVNIIARDNNEYVDDFMLQYKYDINESIVKLNRNKAISGLLTNEQEIAIKDRLKLIADGLVLQTSRVDNIRFLNGKSGIALFLFHYARLVNDNQYHQVALTLLDNIGDEISEDSPVICEDGVAGFGMALEHLVAQSFIKIDTDEILEDIDVLVNYYIIKEHDDDALYQNIIALGKYYITRFNNPVNYPYTYREPKNRILLDDIVELIQSPANTFYDAVDFMDFLCELYLHSTSRPEVIEHFEKAVNDLQEIINNYTGDDLLERVNPVYTAEVLLRFSNKINSEYYHSLANDILKNFEDSFWANMNNHPSGDDIVSTGINYLQLATLLNKKEYATKGIALLLKFTESNNYYIDIETIQVSTLLKHGLAYLVIVGELDAVTDTLNLLE